MSSDMPLSADDLRRIADALDPIETNAEIAENPLIGRVEVIRPDGDADDQEPAEPVRGDKWAVRRVWVAFSPKGMMHGPHASQEDALAFVASKLPKVQPVREAGPRTRRPVTDADRAEIRRLHAEGMSTTMMSRQVGRAVSVVARELTAMGLTSNGHRFGARS